MLQTHLLNKKGHHTFMFSYFSFRSSVTTLQEHNYYYDYRQIKFIHIEHLS